MRLESLMRVEEHRALAREHALAVLERRCCETWKMFHVSETPAEKAEFERTARALERHIDKLKA